MINVYKCSELGIGIVTYSPLGRGFFGGKAVVEALQTESFLVCILLYKNVGALQFNLTYMKNKVVSYYTKLILLTL